MFHFGQKLNIQKTHGEEGLGEISTRLETCPRKSPTWLAQETGICINMTFQQTAVFVFM